MCVCVCVCVCVCMCVCVCVSVLKCTHVHVSAGGRVAREHPTCTITYYPDIHTNQNRTIVFMFFIKYV